MTDTTQADPRLTAGLDLLRRTGCSTVEIRYSDDEQPVVWMAVAGYTAAGDPKSGNPARREARTVHEAAAALDPTRAVLRLCEQLVDGGRCAHCHRPTGFEPNTLDTMPADQLVCWYQYDPELQTFRRGCAGGVLP